MCAPFPSLVFTRPGELRKAGWDEFDLAAKQWSIPVTKMKMGVARVVPLSRLAVAVLEELRPVTGKGRYLFPSVRSSRDPVSIEYCQCRTSSSGISGWAATAALLLGG